MGNSTRKTKKNKSQYTPRHYFGLPYKLIHHPDFISMKYSSQSLLIQMCGLYNGFNNGDISVALSDMEPKGWNKSSLQRARNELLKMNWIVETRKGTTRECHLYALSWVPLNHCPKQTGIDPKDFNLRAEIR